MLRRASLPGVLVVAVSGLLAAPRLAAQGPAPDAGRFQNEIDAFREWDTKNVVPPDGVLFVGSSTIRL